MSQTSPRESFFPNTSPQADDEILLEVTGSFIYWDARGATSRCIDFFFLFLHIFVSIMAQKNNSIRARAIL